MSHRVQPWPSEVPDRRSSARVCSDRLTAIARLIAQSLSPLKDKFVSPAAHARENRWGLAHFTESSE